MTRLRTVLLALIGVLTLGAFGEGAAAQKTPSTSPRAVMAQFGDAQALGVGPRGHLYVADADRDVVEVLDADGHRRMVLGGSGTQPGEFDTPSDLDPTNGQLILVADTYNGRVQRFSGEGQYLESLPIGQQDRSENATWRFDETRDGVPVQGDGLPIAVARDDEGAIFVLDRRERRIFKWSDLGRMESIASRYTSRLQKPIALAVGEGRRLYVADAGREAVFVYDTFGTFRRRIRLATGASLRAVTVYREHLWIICTDRVLIWEPDKGYVTTHPVDLPGPLVDAGSDGENIYFLTPTRLYRQAGW